MDKRSTNEKINNITKHLGYRYAMPIRHKNKCKSPNKRHKMDDGLKPHPHLDILTPLNNNLPKFQPKPKQNLR